MFLISQSELETLSSNLAKLKELNQKSQKEEQLTRLRIKRQRNAWEAVAGAMLIGMIARN